jgi:hypothetical protein
MIINAELSVSSTDLISSRGASAGHAFALYVRFRLD